LEVPKTVVVIVVEDIEGLWKDGRMDEEGEREL
jgi:hypothetical protein